MGRIHIVAPEGVHQRAKQAAARGGKTLKQYVITALEHEVANEKPPKPVARRMR